MRRTQIYLDEGQKQALRLLALDRGSTVSDLVREAVSRLLRDEVQQGHWSKRLGTLQERIQKSIVAYHGRELTEKEVDAAAREARATVAARRRRAAT